MKHENTMNTADNLHYIATCELAECPPSLTAYSAARKPELLLADDLTDSDPGDEPAKGAVVASSLLAFAEGMSRQSKEDVMDSFLFATLVANKAFNPETQGDQWYDKFNEVLSRLGWLSTHWNYARYHAITLPSSASAWMRWVLRSLLRLLPQQLCRGLHHC
ncbi:hypothetical protein ALP45_02434 [Pseudomonas coronafaciens pv. atropurpurea]|nr:Uncharacterized protein ALO66_01787 [Pseudomonas coronafaciens pv. atropurpurea]RMT65009.1 hypothetical protein ALP45_02434 [Pseudomonas coronafaciens pv. atropurpurea]